MQLVNLGTLSPSDRHRNGNRWYCQYPPPNSVSACLYSQSDYSYVLTINVQYGMVILLTIFSCISLLAGCIGICGVYQFSKQWMNSFLICMIVCLIGFGATAAIALAIPLYFQNGGCLGSSYAATSYLNNQTTSAALKLCKTALGNCTCYLNQNGSSYSSLNSISGLATNNLNYTFPISVFRCPNWTIGVYDTTLSAFEYNL